MFKRKVAASSPSVHDGYKSNVQVEKVYFEPLGAFKTNSGSSQQTGHAFSSYIPLGPLVSVIL